jgi:hypothetical protein
VTDIELNMIEHNGREYGAGRCTVTIGRAAIEGVALYADPNKIVLGSPDLAKKWLVKYGLPEDKADNLLSRLA